MNNYKESMSEYLQDHDQYWTKVMEPFTWFTPYKKVYEDNGQHDIKWFVDGKLNLCYDCLDKKVQDGLGDKLAYIYDSEITKSVTNYTYNQILYKVSRLAKALVKCVVKVGDGVLINMPTIIETFFSMLAVSRIGACFHVLMGDFSDENVANRIDEFECRVAIVCNGEYTANGVRRLKENLDRANELAVNKIEKFVVLCKEQFPKPILKEGRDIDFEEAIRTSEPQECIPVEANSPLFVIFTSGTTGKPKGMVHTVRGIAASVVIDQGAVIGAADCNVCYIARSYAWISGMIGNCFMPLFFNVTSLLYEVPPTAPHITEIYRLLAQHKIENYYVPIPLIRIFKSQDPLGEIAKTYAPFYLKKLHCGGVPADISIMEWMVKAFGLPSSQAFGSTEFGSPVTIPILVDGKIVSEPILSCHFPLPGFNVRILREDGSVADANEVGEVVLKAPFPPTMVSRALKYQNNFIEDNFKPFPGYFDFHDSGKLDAEGRLYVYSRSDDVFKAPGGGNKISCNSLEDVISHHEDVVESVVITKLGDYQGSKIDYPIAFVVAKKDAKSPKDKIANDIADMVHKELGNFVPIGKPLICDSLPRTISGKLQRGILKNLVDADVNELLGPKDELQEVRQMLYKFITTSAHFGKS